MNTMPRMTIGVLLLLFAVHLFIFSGFQIDDSFISLRYAKNFADGFGLRFNAEYPPVEGYSNFLWVILAAALFFLKVPVHSVVLVMNVGASVALFIGLYRLSKKLGYSDAQSVVSLFLLATSTSVAQVSGNGLETPLFSALLIWALGFAVDELRSPNRVSKALPMLWLLSITRLEGIGYLILYAILLFSVRPRGTVGNGLRFQGAIWVGVYGLYTLWRVWYFQSFLPNTYVAKLNPIMSVFLPGVHELFDFMQTTGGWAVFALAMFGGLCTSRQTAGLLFGCTLLQVLIAIRAGGDWMPGHRMFVPVLPIVFLLVQIAVCEMVTAKPVCSLHTGLKRLGAGMVILLILFHTVSQDYLIYKRDWSRELRENYTEIGMFMKSLGNEGDHIALVDVGAIGFYSGLNVIDLGGLTDYTIARLPRTTHIDYTEQGNAGLLAYLKQIEPRFIGITPDRFEIETIISNDPYFLSQYRVLKRNDCITLYERKVKIHDDPELID